MPQKPDLYPSDRTSSMLVHGMRARDPQAWEAFWKQYGPRIYLWARHQGATAEDAHDISQEVAAKVNLSLEGFSKSDQTGAFRKWLRLVTASVSTDYFRRHARQPHAEGGTDAQAWVQNVAFRSSDSSDCRANQDERASIAWQRIEEVKSELKGNTWEVFWQREMEEVSTAEVAKRFGMTERAVRLACFRVRAKLRLDGDPENESQ